MHKFILEIFSFLKNLFQFIRILMLFSILMLLLFWIQNLINGHWAWLDFIKPFLSFFVWLGSLVSDNSISLFNATFEYKYFWALAFIILLYYIFNLFIIGTETVQEAYGDGCRLVKKIEEEAMNKSMQLQNKMEQEQIKNYQIFVSTSIKKKFSHRELGVDLEEQNRIMNKFLIEKTGVVPDKQGNGFVYSFSDFAHIDDILQYFFRLINSDAPLDYVICVQIFSDKTMTEKGQLKKLIELNFVNKITTLSDTVWRYKFNKTHRYSTSQLGVFQKDGITFEVHQFDEM